MAALPPPDARTARRYRLIGPLAVALSIALMMLLLYAGDPGSPGWWPIALPTALWVCGPALLAWAVARWRASRIVVHAMLAFVIASMLVSGFFYGQAFFLSQSSTAALILIWLPLWQWIALLVGAPLALLVSARRQRPG